jgi:Cys-tRNA(Pro)/Cys-tRNA(Cys) deacylase
VKHAGGTPATALLHEAGVDFVLHEFEHDGSDRNFGAIAAAALGAEPDRVFKTLLASVDHLPPANIVVGIVPVTGQLSLKELAATFGVKRADMCDPVVAQRVTGYVVGGISPFGQRKLLPTAIDETCLLFDTIFVSGGKRGLEIELRADDLISLLGAVTANIAAPK